MKIISVLSDLFAVLKICEVKVSLMLSFLLIGILASVFSISTLYVIFSFITETISINTDLISATQNSANHYFNELQIFQNILFVFVFISANFAIQLYAIYQLHRFSQNISHKISVKLTANFMSTIYYDREVSATEALRSIIASEAQEYATLIIMPILEILKAGLLLCIGVFVIAQSIQNNAVYVILIMLIIFAVYFLLSKKIVSKLGQIRSTSVEQRLSLAEAAMSNYKYVKAYKAERRIMDNFEALSQRLHRTIIWSMVISNTPKHVIENIIFVSVVGLVFSTGEELLQLNQSSIEALIFCLVVSLRILPEMQRVFNGLSRIIYGRPVSDSILKLSKKLDRATKIEDPNISLTQSNKPDSLSVKSIGVYNQNSEFLFNGISFDARMATITLIKGQSGTGKSTLLEVLMNLRKLDIGTIEYSNLNTKNFEYSYVAQDPLIIPGVIKNSFQILLGDQWLRESPKIIEYLKYLNLIKSRSEADNFLNKNAELLSGGERQRLSIIIALLSQHKFILLDEPTSSLDSSSKALVAKLVAKIVKLEHRCAIIVTHDNCFDEVNSNMIELK